MKIERIKQYDQKAHERINFFLEVLTGQKRDVSEEQLGSLLDNPHIHLFLAYDDKEEIVGMTTLAVTSLCTGKRAWVEDVVVDPDHQGKGYGRKMMEFIIEYAQKEEVDSLMLTSRPTRVAANTLYQTVGFEQRKTNVYQMKF